MVIHGHFLLFQTPSVGTVTVNGNLAFTYDHDGSEGNEVTFTYRATDDAK